MMNHESDKQAILSRAQAAGWPCVVLRGGSIHSRELWERAVGSALPLDLEDLARQLPAAEAAVARAATFEQKEADREERLVAAHATDKLDAELNARVDKLGAAAAKLAPEREQAERIGAAVAEGVAKALKGAR